MEHLKKIKNIIQLQEENILNVYLYGSQVYQTNNETSDYDFVVVIKNKLENKNNQEIRNGLYNIHLITEDNFQKNLSEHKIKEIECYFLPEEFKLKETKKFNFKLNLSKLREEISSKSNNSWVKAKKKMDISEEDSYIGLKSLFHAIRIVDFGTQIAKFKTIKDYSSQNKLFFQLKNEFNTHKEWTFFKEKYQKELNSMNTEFRKLAPKEIEKLKTFY